MHYGTQHRKEQLTAHQEAAIEARTGETIPDDEYQYHLRHRGVSPGGQGGYIVSITTWKGGLFREVRQI